MENKSEGLIPTLLRLKKLLGWVGVGGKSHVAMTQRPDNVEERGSSAEFQTGSFKDLCTRLLQDLLL